MEVIADGRIGCCIGGYRVESVIGIGGMGHVYSAEAPDGETVALKVAKRDLAADETFRKRFALEAEIARSVSNPHVVRVIDTGEHDGVPFIAEQYIEGESIADRLRREGRLDVTTTLRICADAAEGLQAMWSAGMVHRDVKPGNILLDGEGRGYITDFGLAKNTHGSVLTLPGQSLGTLDYMAPEQIRGEPVTSAADVYSLGCVVFECLQGRPPFADRQGMRVLWAHLQDEPPDPTAAGPLPAPFLTALKSALRKEAEDRPETCVAYMTDLARAAAESFVETPAG